MTSISNDERKAGTGKAMPACLVFAFPIFGAGCLLSYIDSAFVSVRETHGYFARVGLPWTFWKIETWLQEEWFSVSFLLLVMAAGFLAAGLLIVVWRRAKRYV